MHDMERITAHCRARGVPVIWDLSHSAGAVPLALNRWGVEHAVGCTYKFLNGGPGAPAYIYMVESAIAAHEPVMSGWCSQSSSYQPRGWKSAASSPMMARKRSGWWMAR